MLPVTRVATVNCQGLYRVESEGAYTWELPVLETDLGTVRSFSVCALSGSSAAWAGDANVAMETARVIAVITVRNFIFVFPQMKVICHCRKYFDCARHMVKLRTWSAPSGDGVSRLNNSTRQLETSL